MAIRFIKDTIWTSPNLNSLSDAAERHFFRLLPLPDDHGCCEITPKVVKGKCYPLKQKVTPEMIEKWTYELEQNDILRTWKDKERVYAYFPTWSEHQRIRARFKRKTPEPPTSVVNCRQVETTGATLLSSLSTLHSPSPPQKGSERVLNGFESFWNAYPKRVAKGRAETAWKNIAPNEQLQSQILAAIERAKTSDGWAKDQGRFIPHPATWLNAKGWLDEPVVLPKAKPLPVYQAPKVEVLTDEERERARQVREQFKHQKGWA